MTLINARAVARALHVAAWRSTQGGGAGARGRARTFWGAKTSSAAMTEGTDDEGQQSINLQAAFGCFHHGEDTNSIAQNSIR